MAVDLIEGFPLARLANHLGPVSFEPRGNLGEPNEIKSSAPWTSDHDHSAPSTLGAPDVIAAFRLKSLGQNAQGPYSFE